MKEIKFSKLGIVDKRERRKRKDRGKEREKQYKNLPLLWAKLSLFYSLVQQSRDWIGITETERERHRETKRDKERQSEKEYETQSERGITNTYISFSSPHQHSIALFYGQFAQFTLVFILQNPKGMPQGPKGRILVHYVT